MGRGRLQSLKGVMMRLGRRPAPSTLMKCIISGQLARMPTAEAGINYDFKKVQGGEGGGGVTKTTT